jgi:hypothetical protein
VITESAILCPTLSKNKQLCILGCPSFEAILKILQKAKVELADILHAIEFMDKEAMYSVLTEERTNINPFGTIYHPFYCLIEVASNNEGPSDTQRLFKLLESSSDLMIVINPNFIF